MKTVRCWSGALSREQHRSVQVTSNACDLSTRDRWLVHDGRPEPLDWSPEGHWSVHPSVVIDNVLHVPIRCNGMSCMT